jgi:hypothetical protein
MNKFWQTILYAMVVGVAAPLFASPANVSIQPQALGSALQELAKQSGVHIIFFSKAVEGHRAPALSGTYTPEDAVGLLLEGTGLTYHVLNERAIEVAVNPAAPAPSPIMPVLRAPLDQVKVTAEREGLNAMREEIQRLDEQFYAAYNNVNTAHQYDILCTTQARRGTDVAQHICQPAFVNEAMRNAAADGTDSRCTPAAVVLILQKTPEHQRNMRKVVAKHPELLKLLKERHELARRYEALRKEKLKGGDGAPSVTEMKRPPSPSLAPLAAQASWALAGCAPQDLPLERLSTEQWAVAMGLEPVELAGNRYFCVPQPGVAHPIRTSANCVTLSDRLRRRAFLDGRVTEGFPNPNQPSGVTGGQFMNPQWHP